MCTYDIYIYTVKKNNILIMYCVIIPHNYFICIFQIPFVIRPMLSKTVKIRNYRYINFVYPYKKFPE